jgi:hypothetical protein
MSENFQVCSQGILWSHVLQNLLGDWKHNFFKHQEVFSELGFRVLLENGLQVSRHFLFYRFETNQRCYKDSKNIEAKLKSKETTNTLVFVKYLVSFFRSHTIRAFSVFLEDSLRITSGIWRVGKNLKTDSDSAHQH